MTYVAVPKGIAKSYAFDETFEEVMRPSFSALNANAPSNAQFFDTEPAVDCGNY